MITTVKILSAYGQGLKGSMKKNVNSLVCRMAELWVDFTFFLLSFVNVFVMFCNKQYYKKAAEPAD